ncbi:MAG: ATP synthase F1 subunit gamma [Mycoplasma sp.]|nr:ATP synthase F1 subunit gamma [Mycoplasma sp.]
MASLEETKRRIKSVTTTRKITKAMQLVATAKLKRAKDNLENIQEYYSAVYDTFHDLLSNVEDIKKLLSNDGSDTKLFIVINSDLGLCGGYNSNIFKLVKQTSSAKDKIISLGSKGIGHYKAIDRKLQAEFPSVGDHPNYEYASKVAMTALALYKTGEISEINLVYTKFINSITFEPTVLKLLPMEETKTEKKTNDEPKKLKALTSFEPNPETVVKNSLPLFISSVIYGALAESKVSEMSSRRTAMENATDNADEIIEKLDLEYNRARQAAITQEISEIVAGAEAI